MVCDAAMVASTVASLMMNGICCVWQMQEEEERREQLRRDLRVEYERQRLMDLELWAEQRSVSASTSNSTRTKHYHSDSSLPENSTVYQQELRRRQLLKQKMDAVRFPAREGGSQERDSNSSSSGNSVVSNHAVVHPMDYPTKEPSARITFPSPMSSNTHLLKASDVSNERSRRRVGAMPLHHNHAYPVTTAAVANPATTTAQVKRTRSTPILASPRWHSTQESRRRTKPLQTRRRSSTTSDVSSLFQFDDSDDDNDDEDAASMVDVALI